MKAIGSRRRSQPAPPWAIFADLCDPNRQPVRPWLHLRDDEMPPAIVESVRPHRVVWSSLWVRRPDAQVRFDLEAEPGGGTYLRWTLYVDDPIPDAEMTRHMCKRIGELINANLRHTYGQ
ncbi:hypothetical protein H7J87_35590 [Mycolicibacterium wolinskyi]|uniref:Polyketide cyclase / dehydrase and lipid transport n=1 Tax=Mycolicibacterium wolinskyi TaxID=59750 RepID=A0A1X2FEW7_9MYCO|nr:MULTISPECIES: hypothetical protein [Mycolicibacterium]MCV7290663.1 hypothetical protein [Mycolicibacterium wolinskyi]MCV7291713.1 hypothetical protein [Mycolicibacterium goodii]ORX16976.1 hypothetical protein AWC31_19245 [Mycolicibacterium wolinskyi]